MSVTTVTNRATNGSVGVSATNWAAIAGTGGTASGARVATAGYSGTGFYRVTWSGATTATSQGGLSYTQTGLAAATQYSHSIWVRSSKVQYVQLAVQYQNASAVNVGSPGFSSAVLLLTNIWTNIKVEAHTSGAAVDRAVLTVLASVGSVVWQPGDTLDGDALSIRTGPTALPTFFDGNTPSGASTFYAWTGTADASTSTATTYVPEIALVPRPLFDPTPRVEVTITDMSPTANTVTLWRTADGKRQAVRGFRKKELVTSSFVIDNEPPLGRPVTYELEVLSGVMAQAAANPATTQVDAASGAMQDPLVPGSSIPIHGDFGPGGEAYIRDQALKDLEYAIDASVIPIMGSPDPVAILGQRMAARGVDMSMTTRAAQAAADLRNLLKDAGLVLVRPLPEWSGALPGLCYMAIGSPREQPVDEAWGGQLIRWQLVGDLVAAPTMNVLVPLWTYGDVEALWDTYQQAQTALSGKTYLEATKSPTGT
jgi:hypothetical protein